MKQALGGTVFLAAGALLGLVAAVMSVDRLGAAAATGNGPWTSWSSDGGKDYGFFGAAHYLLGGRLPPAPGLAAELSATRDDQGAKLDAACSYVIEGKPEGLAWWSLAAATTGGTATAVSGLVDSASAVVEADGALRITVAPDARPGNWIKPPRERSFMLLFTTVHRTSGGTRLAPPALSIVKGGC